MAAVEVDQRKLGKNVAVDAENNVFAKSVLPVGGFFTDAALGKVQALTAASPDPASAPEVASGTKYAVMEEGITTTIAVPGVVDGTGTLEFIVTQSVVKNYVIDLDAGYTAGFVGLGVSGGTTLTLADAKIGDRIKLFCYDAPTNQHISVIEAVGKWTNA